MSAPGIKPIAVALLGLLAGALILAAVALLARGSGNAPIQIVLPTPGAPVLAVAATGPGPGESVELRVYVSGAVRNPGVYRLDAGDRLEDALAAAGGPSGEADVTRVNLARRVQDEEHYHIPKVGETSRDAATASDLAEAGSNASAGSLAGSMVIDLNSASVELLENLPGIGQVKARAIVDFREQNGKYSSVEDIKNVKGIGEVTYQNIRDLVTVSLSP